MDNFDNVNLFIRSIGLIDDIDPKLFEFFPLNIPALKGFVSFRFTNQVTIFNGDNGCGKSTIIEAIASKLNIPIAGGNSHLGAIIENHDIGEESSSELAKYIYCDKGFKKPYRTFFFKAESFYKLADILSHDGCINIYNYASKDLLKQSHGESFMDFMRHQLIGNSLFILDEPEAALSPENQLKLMMLIDQMTKEGSQFILASHSPFILGYRDAKLINLDDGMKEITFKQTKIYNLYKHFLNDPEGYQKLVFDEE